MDSITFHKTCLAHNIDNSSNPHSSLQSLSKTTAIYRHQRRTYTFLQGSSWTHSFNNNTRQSIPQHNTLAPLFGSFIKGRLSFYRLSHLSQLAIASTFIGSDHTHRVFFRPRSPAPTIDSHQTLISARPSSTTPSDANDVITVFVDVLAALVIFVVFLSQYT